MQFNLLSVEASPVKDQIDGLTQQGQQLLDKGFSAEAIQTWNKSLQEYKTIGYQQGVKGTLLNQAIAYMRLGQYNNACTNLIVALDLNEKVCLSRFGAESTLLTPSTLSSKLVQTNPDQPFVVAAYQNLGHVLRSLGKLEDSTVALKHALQVAQDSNQPIAPILLSMANTERADFSKDHSMAQGGGDTISQKRAVFDAQQKADSAFRIYGNISKSSNPTYSLSAKINWLGLYAELVDWLHTEEHEALVPVLVSQREAVTSQAETYIDDLLNSDFNKTTPSNSVYNRLRLTKVILSLAKNQNALVKNSHILAAFNQAKNALDTARNIENLRGESEALGMIGKLYEYNNQVVQAQKAYEQANTIALAIQAADLSYQWEWALGRLARDAGQTENAIEYYKGSIKNLEQVRNEILFVNSELNYSFRKSVEPVYKQYMTLLLAQPNPNLNAVVQAQEKLQATEVENYLQCGQLNLAPLSQVISNLDEKNRPSVFYILDLDEKYAVIVSDSRGRLHYYIPNYQKVLDASSKLNIYVDEPRFEVTEQSSFLPYAKVLYDELIAPAENSGYIPKQSTLVFSEDAFVQNIPFAMLYDGQRYLIEKHSLSVALGSGLRNPQLIQKQNSKAVFAGLSKKSPSFSLPIAPKGLEPLEDVETEAGEISSLLKLDTLLNKKFTWENLQSSLYPGINILQISTHGKFSSDPSQTVLFGWNEAINSFQIRNLLRGETDKPNLDLLFLSACETAKGDKHSTLGIAGIAAQAGARSTVATLWQVKSKSTPNFVKTFYQTLLKPDQLTTKAVALQKAQLNLLQDNNYSHPYYWASFILVGSWL